MYYVTTYNGFYCKDAVLCKTTNFRYATSFPDFHSAKAQADKLEESNGLWAVVIKCVI